MAQLGAHIGGFNLPSMGAALSSFLGTPGADLLDLKLLEISKGTMGQLVIAVSKSRFVGSKICSMVDAEAGGSSSRFVRGR